MGYPAPPPLESAAVQRVFRERRNRIVGCAPGPRTSILDADTTVVYDETAWSSFSTAKTYTYGNPAHLQLTEVTETNSGGTQRITRMKYPADYASASGGVVAPSAAAIAAMRGTAHMHSAVIERWVSEKVGGTERVLEAELMSFRTYLPGQILPEQRLSFSNVQPVTDFLVSAVAGVAGSRMVFHKG